MSDSLPPNGLQQVRLPCLSLSPGICWNPCPLSQCCHPTISSSVYPFSFCLQSLTASGYFPVSQLFASGGQSIGASASVSVLPMNIQSWFPCCPRDSQESSLAPQFESIHSSALSFFMVQLSHLYMTTRKTRAFTISILLGLAQQGTNLREWCPRRIRKNKTQK